MKQQQTVGSKTYGMDMNAERRKNMGKYEKSKRKVIKSAKRYEYSI